MARKSPQEILASLQAKYGDVFKTTDCYNEGVTFEQIKKMVDEDLIYQFNRGMYVATDSREDSDNLYLYQQKYSLGVVSGLSALYLHGFSIRTPGEYTFTFPQGYNNPSLKNQPIIPNYVIKKNYELGVIEMKTYYGNTVKAYDLERTLCDIVKGQGEDIQIVNYAFKQYCDYPDRNIDKLMNYARQLHVDKKVSKYLEILL